MRLVLIVNNPIDVKRFVWRALSKQHVVGNRVVVLMIPLVFHDVTVVDRVRNLACRGEPCNDQFNRESKRMLFRAALRLRFNELMFVVELTSFSFEGMIATHFNLPFNQFTYFLQ